MKSSGIYKKLVRVFILQMLFISLITVLGVYAAALVVDKVMIRTALEDEAAHFWQLLEENPLQESPHTDNLRGYLMIGSDQSHVPKELQTQDLGFGRVTLAGKKPILYIEQKGQYTLYLVFDEQSVRALSFYFGVVPLSLVLIVIYVSAWFTYRASRQSLSPMVSLAQTMQQFDITKDDLDSLQLDHYTQVGINEEVRVLAESLKEFTLKLKQQLQRERQFTRDVSHELRTPLAVIRGSLDLLEKHHDLKPTQQRAVNRMQTTAADMLSLIETLLMLARETEQQSLQRESICINTIAASLIEQIGQTHNTDNHVKLVLKNNAMLHIETAPKAADIVLSNLLRNACNYTHHGEVTVIIDQSSIVIQDNGEGISADKISLITLPFQRDNKEQTEGFGLGLDIVSRLCERFDWQLTINSKLGQGTGVKIQF